MRNDSIGGPRRAARTLRPRSHEARDAVRRWASRAANRGCGVQGREGGGEGGAEVWCRACREAPHCGHSTPTYPDGLALRSNTDRRNDESDPEATRSLSRVVAKERRAIRRREAIRQLRLDVRLVRPYRKLLGFQQVDGSEIRDPAAAFEALGDLLPEAYGETTGSVADWFWRWPTLGARTLETKRHRTLGLTAA